MPLADPRTLEALEFAGVRERVVRATRTERGRAQAADLAPYDDFDRVREEQRRIEAVHSALARGDLHVMQAVETAELTSAAQVGRTLGAAELRSLGDALGAAAAAWRSVRESPALAGVVAAYTPLRELARAIVDAIDERGAVLDRASPALGRIRRSFVQAQADARDRVNSILNSAKHAKTIQDRIVTIRNGRFVIPIKAEASGSLPGIVHDTSASGQTLFVEPLAALEANNRVRTLQIEEEREVQRILEGLSRDVGRHAAEIEANIEVLAAIDVLVAKAEVARRSDSVAPELSEAAEIAIDRGRHPLLGDRAVPQSLHVDEATRVLVISGPNMGGKTVALKMAGLFVVMSYCGMQIPAARARIGRFERLVADIGDEQSLVANTSTFSAHLQRMREIVDGADARTLAIVDEIGGGTEPSAGAALARAMIEMLLDSGARVIVSTHSMELKLFAHSTAGVANASVRFDPKTFTPTFELDLGTPGQSLAFPLASRLGIDSAIVERAEALLDQRERDYEAALAELATRSSELRAEREQLEAYGREAARAREAMARERDEFETERRGFGVRAEERLQQSLRDFVRELQRRAVETTADAGRSRKVRATPAQAALLAQTIDAMRRDLGIGPAQERAEESQSFEAGDFVRIVSMNQDGVVAEDYGDRLLVSAGSMKMLVDRTDVRRRNRAAAPARASNATAQARLSAAGRTVAALDVRGKRYSEAQPLVERWIDDALLAGNSALRLVHGKGTGMLGRGLQEYLRTHPGVKSLRYGNEEEGSTGVTMIELQT
jgi:DNA mismatch repair protein MutS2